MISVGLFSASKKAFLLAMASVALVHAGSIGPDAFGYSAVNGPLNWTNISSTGTPLFVGNLDDSAVSANIGFDFNFYGSTFNSLFVSTNGLITFGTDNASFSNQDLTINDQSDPTIAPYWDDLRTNSGNVYVQTSGAPGSRTFTIQWNSVGFFDDRQGPISFDVILYETLNIIQFNYLNLNSDNGSSATVGIADSLGTGNGRVLQWSLNGQNFGTPAAESSIIFGVANSAVPEPGSLGLLGAGLAVLACAHRLRRRA